MTSRHTNRDVSDRAMSSDFAVRCRLSPPLGRYVSLRARRVELVVNGQRLNAELSKPTFCVCACVVNNARCTLHVLRKTTLRLLYPLLQSCTHSVVVSRDLRYYLHMADRRLFTLAWQASKNILQNAPSNFYEMKPLSVWNYIRDRPKPRQDTVSTLFTFI